MLRGINQTQLFYDAEDRQEFLNRVARLKADGAFGLLAYCLMGNHIHLLIQEKEESLSLSMKRLSLSYSYWFNAKYDRSGYLFQGRFKSEPVNDDAYLLAVFRYIHHNPLKIGERIDSWTSYNDYLSPSELIDSDLILSLFSDDKAEARTHYRRYMSESLPEKCEMLDIESERLSDRQAIEKIKQLGNIDSCNQVAEFDKEVRDKLLCSLKKERLSVRQISRLTGINRGIVQRAGSKRELES